MRKSLLQPDSRGDRRRVISFLTQDETKRLFAAIKNKRDCAIFLTASRHGCPFALSSPLRMTCPYVNICRQSVSIAPLDRAGHGHGCREGEEVVVGRRISQPGSPKQLWQTHSELPSARVTGRLSNSGYGSRPAVSDLAPDCLGIEIEDRAHGGEGQAVLGIGQHPLPRLARSSRDFSTVGFTAR